jgi:hypothetical protein
MESTDHIENLIVASSDGFFSEPEIREDLHVTIRVASDFYDFLVKYGETPPSEEIDYMMGTIRSGMDQFFALAYVCGIINTGSETWRVDTPLHCDFPILRERFLSDFEHLAGTPDASMADRLASLLALTHLELVFLGQHFPSAIFKNVASSSQPSSEFLSDLSEWQAGRLSFDDVNARLLARRYKGRS